MPIRDGHMSMAACMSSVSTPVPECDREDGMGILRERYNDRSAPSPSAAYAKSVNTIRQSAAMDWEPITVILMVAAGGAVGAMLRYGAGQIIDSESFPWSTFAVNFIGCFLIALIFFALGHQMPDAIRYFLFIGIFGAFTTMSTFTLETVTMFTDGRVLGALANVFLNSGVCLFAAFAGRYVALLI